jgi:hypothetical protein
MACQKGPMLQFTTFRLVASCSLAIMAGAALAQTSFPGRMPGDVPYAHEYGASRPFQPPVMPPPPPPVITPAQPPEQSSGYQLVRPAPRSEPRLPERHAIPPENIPLRGSGDRRRLIDVPGPRILER